MFSRVSNKVNFSQKNISKSIDDEISIYYDPMIAKVIVKGQDRMEAIKRLDNALSKLFVNILSNLIELLIFL